jgi:hypothetical protein
VKAHKTRNLKSAASAQLQGVCCPIVELRQYTLHPGKGDVLVDLFEREFIEPQEELGMTIIGQFRDLGNPERFVWLRGFQNMTARMGALQSFYGGPIWKANREAANETMTDSDNVLLLRPARSESGFVLQQTLRPAREANDVPDSIVTAAIYYFDSAVEVDFIDFFERKIKPALSENGFSDPAYFLTENSENTFPALPVREGENVFVWFARFANAAACERSFATLDQSRTWRDEVSVALQRRLTKPPEILRLAPTARSLLR